MSESMESNRGNEIPESSEGQEAEVHRLQDATTTPGAHVERTQSFQQAEAVEAAFTEAVDTAAQSGSLADEDMEDQQMDLPQQREEIPEGGQRVKDVEAGLHEDFAAWPGAGSIGLEDPFDTGLGDTGGPGLDDMGLGDGIMGEGSMDDLTAGLGSEHDGSPFNEGMGPDGPGSVMDGFSHDGMTEIERDAFYAGMAEEVLGDDATHENINAFIDASKQADQLMDNLVGAYQRQSDLDAMPPHTDFSTEDMNKAGAAPVTDGDDGEGETSSTPEGEGGAGPNERPTGPMTSFPDQGMISNRSADDPGDHIPEQGLNVTPEHAETVKKSIENIADAQHAVKASGAEVVTDPKEHEPPKGPETEVNTGG